MIKSFLIIMLFSICLSGFCQEKISGIQINHHYGKIVPHHKNLQQLESFYNMYDFRLFWRTNGSDWRDVLYKYPIYGMGVSFMDIRNKSIGNPMNIYGYVDFPLTKYGKYRVGMEFNIGVSLGYNGFHPKNNPENRAISSDINCYVSLALPIRIELSKRMDFSFAPAIYHSSNGGSKVPNTGLNMVGGSVGMLLYFEEKERLLMYSRPKINSRTYFDFYAASGYVDIEGDYSNNKYLTATISLGVYRRLQYKRKIGVGTDFFYNAANKLRFSEDFKKIDLVQNAIFVSHEYLYRKIGLITQVGLYTYTKYTPTEKIYERVGVRWYIGNAFFTGIAVKAHLFNAEFIEWSIGYSIPI